MIEAVISRAQLRASYGQGFGSSGYGASASGLNVYHGGSYGNGLQEGKGCKRLQSRTRI